MSFETMQFLESVNPAAPGGEGVTIGEIFARAAAARDPGEVSERAEAEVRRAAAMDRAEGLALANRMLGDPLAEISRAQAAAAEARDEIADLESRLAKARDRLARAQGNVSFFAERMQAAETSVSRMATVTGGEDLLGPAKQAHREYVAASRAAWQAAQAGTARRPFARGGVAVRSDVTCEKCIAAGATPAESFLIHSDPSPGPVPDVPSEAELDMFGRLTGSPYRPGDGREAGRHDNQRREMIYR